MISANPNLLHIYDPSTTNDITVSLPKPPLSVGLSADGLRAAAGHDGAITIIDLTAATILKTVTVTGQAYNIALGDTFVMFTNGASGGVTGVNLQSGTAIGSNAFFLGTDGIFNTDQTAFYLADDGSSPNDMQKTAITGGQFTYMGSWPYHGDYPDCGPYYLAVDGSRIYTSCGTVVHASTDKTLDMFYLESLPAASFPIAGLAEAASLKLLAVIPSAYQYGVSSTAPPDVQVQLFHTDYLTPAENLSLLPFVTPAGSFAAHGKAVFFSRDASRLFVVAQADSTSNLTNPYAVEVIPLSNQAACSVTFTGTPLTVSAAGSNASLAIQAAPDCFYTATTGNDWIRLSGGASGSGNGTLTWLVRPNSSVQPRTGTITINGRDYTIQQGAAPSALPNPGPLSFNVADADYSTALDRIVMVSTSPNELHIYDPAAQADNVVPLILPPFAVSVAPDGLHAAVGHDGWISYVDLRAGTVVQTYPIVSDVHHILLAGNGYIYAFPQRDWSDIYSLQLSSGIVTGTNAIYEGRVPRLEPNGQYFYAIGDQWFSKWDITKGVAVSYFDSPGGAPGYNLWLHQDGSQLIGANAKVYASSDVSGQDVQYVGSFPNISSVLWAANSSALKSTAIIPASGYSGPVADNQVFFFGDAYLGAAGSLPLPQFSSAGKNYTGHGLLAFWNSTATALYVIERADSTANLLSTDSIYTVSAASGCAATPLGAFSTVPAGGGYGSAAIAAGTGCAWSATSDSSWLSVTAGAIGGGPANISFSAAANTGSADRKAHIAIAGQSYPVTQLGTSATPLALTTSSLSFSTVWSSTASIPAQSLSVKAGAGPFGVVANSGWITIAPAGSNTWSVGVNSSGLAAGTSTGAVTVTASDGQIQVVIVTLSIAPKLSASPASVSLRYGPGDPIPTATISISDGTASGSTFSASAPSYATATPSSGTLPATLQVSPSPSLGIGTYSSSLTVYSNSQTLTIPLTITHAGAPVSIAAITDAANFLSGAVSPGEIVVLWGSNLGPANLSTFSLVSNRVPATLAGTTVTFNGTPAPIIYSSSGAICVIVPYEMAGRTSASVVVSYGGSVSPAFTQQVAPAAPHFFMSTSVPAGQIAALNSDYTVNSTSNPAPSGSVVVLYATGEGATSPPGFDGSLVGSNLTQPLANVTVTIGGQPATVLYAGGSPNEVEGLLQINVRIPAGTPPGNAPVTLTIGNVTGPAGGTVAVAP